MKRTILFILLFHYCFSSFSQTINNNTLKDKENTEIKYKQEIDRYKLYPTNNIWVFLKLDTATGRIWAVQWNTSSENRLQWPITTAYKIDMFQDKEINGRFKLQETTNNWNFLLIDTKTGDIWQVQWGFNEEDNMIIKIY